MTTHAKAWPLGPAWETLTVLRTPGCPVFVTRLRPGPARVSNPTTYMTTVTASPGEEGEELEQLNELLKGDWVGPSPVNGPGGPTGPGGTLARVADAEQGSMVGAAPTRAGAAWSLLLPRPLWDYLSRLEFYEGDATLSARTRLFHRWWLQRRVPVARALMLIYINLLAPTIGLYAWVSGAYKVRC